MRHLFRHGRLGKLLLDTFDEAVMLRRIRRSKDDMGGTESCLSQWNFDCAKADWEWWRQRDLDRGHLSEEQLEYFDNEAVWLCARCEDVGARNGRKLAHMAEDRKLLVHKIEALHSRHKKAKRESPKAFDGLRSIVRLVHLAL